MDFSGIIDSIINADVEGGATTFAPFIAVALITGAGIWLLRRVGSAVGAIISSAPLIIGAIVIIVVAILAAR